MTVTRHDTRPHAVVVGGSLAGLMAALGLARAGLRVTVLEHVSEAALAGV